MMRVGVTPVPIPNTLVKTDAADNTWLETTREDRWLPDLWGISSVGRAPALQAGGHEFESRILHSMRAAHRICTLKTAYMEIQNDQEEYLDQDIRGNRGSDYS